MDVMLSEELWSLSKATAMHGVEYADQARYKLSPRRM